MVGDVILLAGGEKPSTNFGWILRDSSAYTVISDELIPGFGDDLPGGDLEMREIAI